VSRRAEGEVWFSGGLSPAIDFGSSYPELPMQPIRLRGGHYVSGALFAASPAGLLKATELLREARRGRKSQFRMVRQFGLGNVILFFARMIDLSSVERALSR